MGTSLSAYELNQEWASAEGKKQHGPRADGNSHMLS